MPLRSRSLSFAPVLALLLAASGQASTVEQATSGFVAYQFDGSSHHDAPDDCASAADGWSAPLGVPTDGMLVAPDDVSDVFLVDVPHSLRGQRLDIRLTEAADLELLELTAFAPGCDGSVLDVSNWPTPEPSPPAPAGGERQTAADLSEPRLCQDDAWTFWAEIVPDYGPASAIHVAWTDGSAIDVPLDHTHGAAHAVYATGHALGTTLKGAWINMPSDWPGSFALFAGPCDAVDGGAVYGEPPVAGMGFLAFTPVHAGRHAVQVSYREPATGDAAASGSTPAPALAPAPTTPAPLSPAAPGTVVQALTPLLRTASSPGDLREVSVSVPTAPGVPSLTMPMSCHGCIDGGDAVAELLSYVLLPSRAD